VLSNRRHGGDQHLVGWLVWLGWLVDWSGDWRGRLHEADRVDGWSYTHTRAGVHDNHLLRLGTMGIPLAPAAVIDD